MSIPVLPYKPLPDAVYENQVFLAVMLPNSKVWNEVDPNDKRIHPMLQSDKMFNAGSSYLQAPAGSSTKAMYLEDRFNSLAKIRSLPESEQADLGFVVLVKTEGDTLAPPEEVDELANLLRARGNRVHVFENKAEDCDMPENLKGDSHMASPIRNEGLREKYGGVIFS